MSAERCEARNEAELHEFAARFARTLRAGDTVALTGPLGAGKTSFVRAIVAELHGSESVSSPTFTLWHRYEGVPPVNHLDWYRLEAPEEAAHIGLEEAFDAYSITLVEWPQNAPQLLPRSTIRISIAGSGEQPRRVSVERP